ncbi:MAG TPA: hypothetical protein VGK67_08085 [Myxococcales bacterium]
MAELLNGPARLRFIIQPLLAILLGLRDSRNDAAEGREPYLLGLVFQKGRKAKLAEGLKTFSTPLVLAVLLDAVVQYLTLRTVWVWAALVTGLLLIALPYSLARGLGNRAFRSMHRRHA